ncbi:SAM-dependent methyltransferase 2, in cluster with Hydroxyacylglutathione hydrolase [hydrothermal vent metagenome]|uniref:SAM-dependent methyltransferase 2, in cluster with Hydroxyacylglutathione hydrolase n=1 Tax=hydrothermal vent metagenome TaxID=652676 RepID=A0A3B1AI28_9ZZZZ
MYQDIGELRAFYDTPLGRVTRRLIQRQITALWHNISGMDIVGLGYAAPYLDIFRSRSKHGAKHGAKHVINIMPALQGVTRWPRHNGDLGNDGPHPYKGNLTALAHDGNLPLKDASIDRILVIHTLEHTEVSRHLLREIWRSLAPGGRVIIIVPNRLGLWARTDRTPFGHGTPFSALQLRQLLSENMLTPTQTTSALHLPPFKSRSLLSLMTTFEGTGQRWWHNLAGALIVEAEKQIYATGPKIKARKRAPQPAIAGNHMDSKKYNN